MHILVTNDDGPPSSQSSPYVHSLILALQAEGHTVSVVLPHKQRSWIGKAHLVNETLKPTYFTPGTVHKEDGVTHERPQFGGSSSDKEWVLLNGTPASCVQVGLFHYFKDRGPIDLVLSGPNYGRNTTALFALSSGTLGGAMEAACCRKKAIALSYAFFEKEHDYALIDTAAKHAVRIINFLYKNWDAETDVYTVNIPLVQGLEKNKILRTNMLQNYWASGSIFNAVEVEDEETADEREAAIREAEKEDGVDEKTNIAHPEKKKHVHFKFAPKFGDVYKSVEDSPPGNDGWALTQKCTSVTPLKANFLHGREVAGEIVLDHNATAQKSAKQFAAVVQYEEPYVQPLIISALKKRLSSDQYTLHESYSDLPPETSKCLQLSAYESIAFERLMADSQNFLANAYVIRKALIRKHFLAATISTWLVKHPESLLRRHVKDTYELELDYAEYLDEALSDAFELRESLVKNAELAAGERVWWILKPSMSDRGQGIRLFSTLEELTDIFEGWENEEDDEDEDEDEEDDNAEKEGDDGKNFIMTSQLRHFVTQEYVMNPLLLEGRKFHIRTYVLAVGSLQVYVYRPMLALSSANAYTPPGASNGSVAVGDMASHLTNTCLQDGQHEGSVRLFWELDEGGDALPNDWKEKVFWQIKDITAETFEAAARGQMVHFQTLPNAFELFGLDFLVDSDQNAWLLEVNAFPDFKQTGEDLKDLVGDLFEAVVDVAIAPFFGATLSNETEPKGYLLEKALDINLGLRS